MTTHSSILAWEISLTQELVGCSLWGCKELDTWQLNNSKHCQADCDLGSISS